MKCYLLNLAIAFDQLFNTLLAGHPDETLSARAYVRRYDPFWSVMYTLINAFFFWQEDHCKASYNSEVERKHLPKDYYGR